MRGRRRRSRRAPVCGWRDRDDAAWMREALRVARNSSRRGEVPIGAVVVQRGRIVGRGANRPIGGRDPTAHAEVVAIRRAAKRLGNYRLGGTTLCVTLEPCLMCLGAMVQARIGRLVYGAADSKIGAVALLKSRRLRGLNHRFPACGGVLAGESAELLRDFFRRRRAVSRCRRALP
ncbi:MAG: tRNA adenosine(34) deaminase TadA [Acidobacteriota bacterium]